jgi:peptidyl-tRNA hydrolase
MNDVIYVILNGSLDMSAGKAASQAVHAAMMLNNKHRTNFTANYRRTVIVLEAKNVNQIYGIVDYLNDANIDHEYYIDEGKNEVDAFSTTALVVEPISSDDKEKRKIFSDLPLYSSKKPKKRWYHKLGYVDPWEDYP